MVFGLFGNKNDDKDDDKKKAQDKALVDKSTTTTAPTSTVPGFITAQGCTALVTGSSGLCGARLVEMLLERGAATVILFDLAAPDTTLQARLDQAVASASGGGKIVVPPQGGNVTDRAAVEAAFKCADAPIDVVFHIAALVGPFHDKDKYYSVNYEGTKNIIEMCQKYKVPKLVYVVCLRKRVVVDSVYLMVVVVVVVVCVFSRNSFLTPNPIVSL